MLPSRASISHLLNPSIEEIEKIKKNVRWAFDDLLHRWTDLINATARKFRTDINDHEDFCQRGRFALYRAVQTFIPSTATFATYASTLIVNAMRDLRRVGRKKTGEHSRTFETTDPYDAETIAYPDHLVEAEEAAMVDRWRTGLSDRDAFIVDSVYHSGMTMTTVAAELGLSAARVSQIIRFLRESARLVA
jgi:RNA polymerase sigma factor (sigma-70 family)